MNAWTSPRTQSSRRFAASSVVYGGRVRSSVGKRDGHVACPLPNSRGTPKRARTVALEGWALVDVGLAHHQLVGRELVVVLRVGDCGVQELQDVPRGRTRRVDEYGTRLAHGFAADVVDHEAGLARRRAHVLRTRPDRDRAVGRPRSGCRRVALAAGGDLRGARAGARLLLLRRRRVLLLGLRLPLGLGCLRLGLLRRGLLLRLLGGGGLLVGLLATAAAWTLGLRRLRLLRGLLLALGLLGLGSLGLDR